MGPTNKHNGQHRPSKQTRVCGLLRLPCPDVAIQHVNRLGAPWCHPGESRAVPPAQPVVCRPPIHRIMRAPAAITCFLRLGAANSFAPPSTRHRLSYPAFAGPIATVPVSRSGSLTRLISPAPLPGAIREYAVGGSQLSRMTSPLCGLGRFHYCACLAVGSAVMRSLRLPFRFPGAKAPEIPGTTCLPHRLLEHHRITSIPNAPSRGYAYTVELSATRGFRPGARPSRLLLRSLPHYCGLSSLRVGPGHAPCDSSPGADCVTAFHGRQVHVHYWHARFVVAQPSPRAIGSKEGLSPSSARSSWASPIRGTQLDRAYARLAVGRARHPPHGA